MTSSRSDRVDGALTSLLERLVPPQQPGESDDSADQRWDDALAFAHRTTHLGDDEEVPTDDAHHVADLIRRRLARHGGGNEGRLGNLYERLLSQPVLTKKSAILYFLLHAEGLKGREERSDEEAQSTRVRSDGRELLEDGDDVEYEEQSEKEAFDEAFARNGLPRVSPARGPESPSKAPVLERGRPAPARSRLQTRHEEGVGTPTPKSNGMVGEPTESALLRDLPFTLQGLSSNNLPFADAKSIKLPTTLPVPHVALLHTLAEPSLLYRSLSGFVESSEGGLVGQSLRAAIEIELRSYLGLVATLEGQIRRALAQLDGNKPQGGLGKTAVTLKRCVVWTREATLGLRLMSTIVESAKGKKGGELITLIHSFASTHGDPFVHGFAERMLTHVTRPFYNMLRAWIYDGELEDPYLEFFVFENEDYEDSGATSVWDHKYRLKESMIPSIMSSDFANRVFLIGKSLNFIRYGCGDSGWVESHSKSASRELQYGDMATLSTSIDEAYKTVMARLLSLMESKFALSSHLQALKKYLLLGQGDFIELLMESLSANLDRPANSQYRHTLTAQLEHAIRNSNAQYDSADVLRRLDARMLELSHGEIGWDVFTLEYRIDSPLDVIVTPWANRQYLKVFNFLFRVKRVEFALSTTWRNVQTGARGVLGSVSDKLGADWKSARGGLAEMIHFVDQLQYYILFEVIEAGWNGLQRNFKKPDATLDTLISAHTDYLRSITRKGLLGGGGTADFTAQLHELLKLMLAYRDAVDGLYSYSVAEFTRRQDLSSRIETRTKAGRWGLTEADESLRSEEMPVPQILQTRGNAEGDGDRLDKIKQRLRNLEVDFRSRTNVLLGDLAHQPDTDMRFLGVAMNFNDVYQPVRKRRQKPTGVDKTQMSMVGSVTKKPAEEVKA
ncbi:hypothetical protein DOTSEDRAFT_70141 [Dothistroma septosporum NZE10]|uniref:Uncharacterized protein n=1 Tax=Dothistroma septosporum (strain NZE10 / CBS 128990) TaxID=675120 RepID=N1PRN2_DOTSN|nr:hypothetical protein DOTSEDRAFT_70141 [Dothistroma septosporum NZE10]